MWFTDVLSLYLSSYVHPKEIERRLGRNEQLLVGTHIHHVTRHVPKI